MKVPEGDQHKMVSAYLAGASQKDAARSVGWSAGACQKAMARLGVASRNRSDSLRRYKVNHDYFATIDCEEKAYWLGFLAADGSIDEARNLVQLELAAVDMAHVEAFVRAVEASGPVAYSRKRQSYKARVRSPRMVGDLAKCGVVPRKSLTLAPWKGPSRLMRHYLRGLFDGDGSICHTAQGRWYVAMVGSRAAVCAFAEYVAKETGVKSRVTAHRRIWRVDYRGLASAQAVAALLYNDASTYLLRKHTLAQELLASTYQESRWAWLTRDVLQQLFAKHKSRRGIQEAIGITCEPLRRKLRQAGMLEETFTRRLRVTIRED